MQMFMGEYQHSVDEKNRLIIPSKFRNQLGDKFIVTNWMEHSLHGFPMEVWDQIEAKLNNLPIGAKEARAFNRFVYAGAVEAEFDKQGRISIPNNLKDYAQIKKDAVVTGSGNGFEIWSKDNWAEYANNTAEQFDQIAEGLVDFDL
jgi:MraZ protein